MNLPFKLFEKKEKIDYYLALLLKDESVKVIVFEEIAGKIKVITHNTENFTTSLEDASFDEWLAVFDKAIGTAESSLPQSIELSKTVFGLKENWVEGTKIKKDYIAKLKKVSDELDLQPIGFLVFSEAIAHFLQQEEGAPVSAILIEAGNDMVILTILRAGRIIETRYTKLKDSLIVTVETLLKEITSMEIFPSRMILFDGDEAEHIAQTFKTHQWSKSLPFLHMPQITILPTDFDAKAILFGTAKQLGFGISDNGEIPRGGQKILSDPESHEKDEAKKLLMEDEPRKKTILEKEASAETFGFMQDTDVAQTPKAPQEESFHPKELPTHHSIPVDKDIEVRGHMDEDEVMEKEVTPRRKPTFPTLSFSAIGNLFTFLKREKTQPSSYPSSSNNHKKRTLFIIAVILIILFIGGYFAYITKLHATVTLYVTPKTIDQNQDITFTTTGNTDVSKNSIHADEVTVSENGDISSQPTGSKDVGTPAKGTVTIYNSGDSTKTLPSGTTITAQSGQKFLLDQDINIASASGDIFSGTKPGTTDVTVTAVDIGPQSNLPSNTKLAVGTSSTLAGKNNNAFSGGTKKTVTVLSKEDMDKMIADLTKNLQGKAKDDLKQKFGTDKELIGDGISASVDKKTFDKNAGDQANSVKLQAAITYKSMAFDKNQLIDFGKHIFADKISKDTILTNNGITYDITNATVKDDKTATATIKFHAGLLPVIDTNDVAKNITGKSLDYTTNYTRNLSQVNDVKIQLSPNLFFLPHSMPKFANHISIVIQKP